MMKRSVYDPIVHQVSAERRTQVQEAFGRHVVEQRNRMALLVRKWIETDAKFPIPIYDRLIERIRQLPSATRADVASISLLMADQIASAVLMVFGAGDGMELDDRAVNYAIVAQFRESGSDEVVDEVDVNRGEPIIALWNQYNRWLSRFAPSDVRAVASRANEDAGGG